MTEHPKAIFADQIEQGMTISDLIGENKGRLIAVTQKRMDGRCVYILGEFEDGSPYMTTVGGERRVSAAWRHRGPLSERDVRR